MGTTPRDPVEVINAVLKHIPEEMTALRAKLDATKESAFYTPPEAVNFIWVQIRDVLQGYVPWPMTEEWHKEVYRIVTQQEPPA